MDSDPEPPGTEPCVGMENASLLNKRELPVIPPVPSRSVSDCESLGPEGGKDSPVEPMEDETYVYTDIPYRLDALPFSWWHMFVVFSLGITWVIDGMEVTMMSALSTILQRPNTLGLSETQVGVLGSLYLIGACVGGLIFGHLADRFGRVKLLVTTLVLYLIAAFFTTLSYNVYTLGACRLVTGLSIGGEYCAIFSAVDELIPARRRGTVALSVDACWQGGAVIGALWAYYLGDINVLGIQGWRIAFFMGFVLVFPVLGARAFIPESPRWLMTHGRIHKAEDVARTIEKKVLRGVGRADDAELAESREKLGIRKMHKNYGVGTVVHTMIIKNPRRFILGISLHIAQAFFFNGIFFSYGQMLTKFYHVEDSRTPLYIMPIAFSAFLGPMVMAPLFDSLGRRIMITATYCSAGIALIVTAILFHTKSLSLPNQLIAWCVTFFLMSPGGSAAQLTISEIFPLEVRASAMSIFFAIGLGLGGVGAPAVFNIFIKMGSVQVSFGYYFAALLLFTAAGVEVVLGVDAERKSLEEVAPPLSGRDQNVDES